MKHIGVLLPRSTDYPAIAFDLLDGIRLSLSEAGITEYKLVTENIGFGEDSSLNYAKAEKMILQDDVCMIICYAGNLNAEPLYPLALSSGIPFLFPDPGMHFPEANPQENCYHISLQGTLCAANVGRLAAAAGDRLLMATSFYDGGYRSPYALVKAAEENGAAVAGNYVSAYRISEFTISPYLEQIAARQATVVGVCFSSYLADLFMKELKAAGAHAVSLPFYCAPYLAEEQLLSGIDFPGGSFRAVVPWCSSVENMAQDRFRNAVARAKNKKANIFHLLGWEAGLLSAKLLRDPGSPLKGWQYESPRGTVAIHPETHHTYASVYDVSIVPDAAGKCSLQLNDTISVSDRDHLTHMLDVPQGTVSSWKNNYFCI